MRQDIGNSLVIARLLDALKIDCYIDQVSFLEEYRKVVRDPSCFTSRRRLHAPLLIALSPFLPPRSTTLLT